MLRVEHLHDTPLGVVGLHARGDRPPAVFGAVVEGRRANTSTHWCRAWAGPHPTTNAYSMHTDRTASDMAVSASAVNPVSVTSADTV